MSGYCYNSSMPTRTVKTDLRCKACVEKIRPAFDAAGFEHWQADVSVPEKTITVEGNPQALQRVDELLEQKGYRVLGEVASQPPPAAAGGLAEKTSYFPLLLILFYLLLASALAEVAFAPFDAMRAMRHFMAGFFFVFSFFKLLNLRAFADAYRMYDVVAMRWPAYGFVYPFIELGLGAAYLANLQPVAVNLVTLVVMGVSTLGIVRSLMKKQKIRCACLGTVFNLPMSFITLVEDLLMVAMAAAMLLL